MGRMIPHALILAAVAASACSSGGPTTNSLTQSVSQQNSEVVTPALANDNANANKSHAGLTREEYEQHREMFARVAKENGEHIGPEQDDGWIWVKTKAALAANPELKSTDIKVDVENGLITLRGRVKSKDQSEEAEKTAERVGRRVRNELEYTDDPVQTLPTTSPTPRR